MCHLNVNAKNMQKKKVNAEQPKEIQKDLTRGQK